MATATKADPELAKAEKMRALYEEAYGLAAEIRKNYDIPGDYRRLAKDAYLATSRYFKADSTRAFE